MTRRFMTGMRPTGRMHLGHLTGFLNNVLEMQEHGEVFLEIADLHAMTDRSDHSAMQSNIDEMVVDWLAAGVDPERTVLFRQSSIPEHSELYVLLSMLSTVGQLQRSPVYKGLTQGSDASIDNPSLGLLGYPVLQAADIGLYKGTDVPVGADQVPHVELTRLILRRFNSAYGDVFPIPEAMLTEEPKLMGIDGRKMSKSYGNTITPSDGADVLNEKTKAMITDPGKIRKNDPGRPDVCSVYSIHKSFNPNRETVYQECSTGMRGCVNCKAELSTVLTEEFSAFRERRAYLAAQPEESREILYAGNERARSIARETLREVKSAMRLV